jgi:hypothetical protein
MGYIAYQDWFEARVNRCNQTCNDQGVRYAATDISSALDRENKQDVQNRGKLTEFLWIYSTKLIDEPVLLEGKLKISCLFFVVNSLVTTT